MRTFIKISAVVVLLTNGSLNFGAPIPGLFSTGLDASGALLDAEMVDPHYQIISSADPTAPGPDAYTLTPGFPVGPWVEEGPGSRWIAPQANQAVGNQPGDYTFRTSFDLTGFDPGTVSIEGLWAGDNGVRLLLNGIDTGLTVAGFGGLGTFTLNSGFVPGLNHMDFILNNAPPGANPVGLRVEMVSDATPIAENTPVTIVTAPSNVSARLGGTATLRVLAQGSAPVTYEWRKGDQLLDWAKTAELTIRNVANADAGQYSVRVSNAVNSVTSGPVTLTIKPALEVTTGRYARITVDGSTGKNYRLDKYVPADFELFAPINWTGWSNFVLAPNPKSIVDPESNRKAGTLYRAVKLD